MDKTVYCNQCGTIISASDSQEYVFCPICGYRNILDTHSGEDYARNNISKPIPSLTISYETNNSAITMATRIVEAGLKTYYLNGSSFNFLLEPGQYTVFIQIGRRTHRRVIVIPEAKDGYTVTINCMFNGHPHIFIDQPGYTANTGYAPDTAAQPQNTVRVRPSVLSFIALLLSVTFFGSPIGVFLSFLDRRNNPDKSHVLDKVAMIVGFVLIGIGIVILYFRLVIAALS